MVMVLNLNLVLQTSLPPLLCRRSGPSLVWPRAPSLGPSLTEHGPSETLLWLLNGVHVRGLNLWKPMMWTALDQTNWNISHVQLHPVVSLRQAKDATSATNPCG